jgi:hypothetical protein
LTTPKAQEIDVAADHHVIFDKALDQQIRIVAGLEPEARVRRDQADDPALALDDNGAKIVGRLGADDVPE